jgi:outer membrane protein TolC
LDAEVNLRRREKTLRDAVRFNQRAVALEKSAYRVGASDMRRVLDQQLALQRARLALIRVRGEILTKRVNLFLALGGDFEIPEEAVEETVQTGSDQ